MAAIKVADLFARIGVKGDTKGLDKMDKKVKETKKSLISMGSVLGALTAGVLTRFIFNTAAAGDRLNKQARFLGFASEELKAYQTVAQDAGLSVRLIDKSFLNLNRQISDAAEGTGEAVEAFKKLDVQLRNNDGSVRSSKELLPEIADGLKGISSQAEKTAIAYDLFGGRGAELLKILDAGSDGLNRQLEAAKKLQFVNEEQRKTSEKFISTLGLAGSAVGEMGERLVIGIITPVTEIISLFVEWIKQNNKLLRLGFDRFAEGLSFVFKNLLRIIGAILRPFKNLIALMTTFISNTNLLVLALGAIAFAFTTAGTALLVFLRRLLLVPAIIAAIALVADDLAVAMQGGDSTIKKMTESTNPLINALGSVGIAFAEVLGIVGRFIAFALAGFPGGLEEMTRVSREQMAKIKAVFQDEIDAITGRWMGFFDGLPIWAQTALGLLGDIIGDIFNGIKKFLGAIVGLFDALFSLVTGEFDEFIEKIKNTFGLLWEAITEPFKTISENIMRTFDQLSNYITDKINGLVDSLKDFGASLEEFIPDFLKSDDPIEVEVVHTTAPTGIELPATKGELKTLKLLPSISNALTSPAPISPLIGGGTTNNSRSILSPSVSVGGITNNIVVPPGTTEEQQSAITDQVNDNMTNFMDRMFIDAQAEVPEAS